LRGDDDSETRGATGQGLRGNSWAGSESDLTVELLVLIYVLTIMGKGLEVMRDVLLR
jgi:hypothetical protein